MDVAARAFAAEEHGVSDGLGPDRRCGEPDDRAQRDRRRCAELARVEWWVELECTARDDRRRHRYHGGRRCERSAVGQRYANVAVLPRDLCHTRAELDTQIARQELED